MQVASQSDETARVEPAPPRRVDRARDAAMMLAYAAVCAPVVGELIRTWRSDWFPTGDDAVHAIHARDVFSLHTPLLGMYSGISTGRPYVYHLGPMVFWALAIPERLFSERMGIVIGAAIVNIVAAVALLRSVRRMYGSSAALAAAAIVTITCWSLGRNTLAEPWNPFIGLIPLMLVLVYALELANGALAPLPWFAAAASFVVQSHYVYIPVVVAAGVVGIVLGIDARRRAPGARTGRRPLIAAAAVTLACWSFPLYDQLAHSPGNFRSWVHALRNAPGVQISVGTAWHYVVGAVGWVPLAARGPLPGRVLFDLQFNTTRLAASVAWLVTAWLVVVAVLNWRRDARTARLATMGAVLVPSTLFAVWRMPLSFPVIPSYRIVMLWPVSAFVWTAALVGVTGVVWGSNRRLKRRPWMPRGRVAVIALAVVTVASSLLAVFGAPAMGPADHTDSRATRAVVRQTLACLPHTAHYLVRGDGDLAYFVKYGVLRALIDHGYTAYVDPDEVQLSRDYASTDPRNSIVLVESTGRPLPSGAHRIADYDQSTPSERGRLERARAASVAALRSEPLRLTPFGEQQRRRASGLRRIALDAVANGTITPDVLLDVHLDGDVFNSRVDPSPTRRLFVVGPQLVPTLALYGQLRGTIGESVVRVAVMPFAGCRSPAK